MSEYIYLIQIYPYTENIFKIGRTSNFVRRFAQYKPQKPNIILCINVYNSSLIENELKQLFMLKFKQDTDRGKEYFIGNVDDMKYIINQKIQRNHINNNINSNNINDIKIDTSIVKNIEIPIYYKFIHHLINNHNKYHADYMSNNKIYVDNYLHTITKKIPNNDLFSNENENDFLLISNSTLNYYYNFYLQSHITCKNFSFMILCKKIETTKCVLSLKINNSTKIKYIYIDAIKSWFNKEGFRFDT